MPAGSEPALRPEHLAASVQTLDLDRWSGPGTPALRGHPEALGLARDSLWGEGPAAVVLVADRAGDRVGHRVVQERLRRRDPSAQAVECEREHGLSHLLAQALALPVARQPRPGVDRAVHGEALPAHGLRPDRLSV